jgi:hypothetical protein
MNQYFVQSAPEHGLIKIDSEGKEWILVSKPIEYGQTNHYSWQPLQSQPTDQTDKSNSVQ